MNRLRSQLGSGTRAKALLTPYPVTRSSRCRHATSLDPAMATCPSTSGAKYENFRLAHLTAWATLLAHHPDLRKAEPKVVEWLIAYADDLDGLPPCVSVASPVGRLRLDAAKLAADRAQVRRGLVRRIREALAGSPSGPPTGR